MRTQILPRRFAALTLATVALIGLTGCTGFPTGTAGSTPSATSSEPADGAGDGSDSGTGEGSADGEQTTAEACALIEETMTEATAGFENLDPENPDAIVEGMEAAVQTLSDLSTEITNEEVAAILPELQTTFQQVADIMAAIVAGDASKVAEFEQLGASFQETGERYQELCAPTE